ncbi:MAG: hypothetical protein JW750_08335 [Anaerolineaceae bacterium]|nr:hypothetical protein [Anaerolineaceae bacterium]
MNSYEGVYNNTKTVNRLIFVNSLLFILVIVLPVLFIGGADAEAIADIDGAWVVSYVVFLLVGSFFIALISFFSIARVGKRPVLFEVNHATNQLTICFGKKVYVYDLDEIRLAFRTWCVGGMHDYGILCEMRTDKKNWWIATEDLDVLDDALDGMRRKIRRSYDFILSGGDFEEFIQELMAPDEEVMLPMGDEKSAA